MNSLSGCHSYPTVVVEALVLLLLAIGGASFPDAGGLTSTGDGGGRESEFFYDNWQCENYLASETINIASPSGRLFEVHIRDNVQVITYSFQFL